MKRYLLAAAALLSLPATVQAQTTTIEGTASVGTLQTSDPGLVVYANPIPFGPFDLDLDPMTGTPSSFTTNVLTIGTNEGSIESDDLANYAISILFSFTNPFDASGGPVTGETDGFYQLFTTCGLIAGGCGRVEWDGPTIFNFGSGGTFSLTLEDEVFHTPGSANVSGTFTLLTPSAVPEPGTWAMMLLGFGATGFAMRRSRAAKTALPQIA